ncbi:hypothetical protein R1flu_027302 [Riccia fluitans]|uniref:Oleosin n=1 Tax=Riccia fluitans TaxID=41844 RepID=A0ABD1XIZ6_9MARC
MLNIQQLKKKFRDNAPNRRQLLGIMMLVTAGVTLMTMGGLIMGGLGIAAAVLTFLFVIFSPVLVPIGLVLFLGVAAFVTPAGFTVAIFSSIRWLYEYFRGQNPVGSGKVDAAKRSVTDTAYHLKEVAVDYLHGAQEKAIQAKDNVTRD